MKTTKFSTKLSITHSATLENPKFEKCKYVCNNEFFMHSTGEDPQFSEVEISH